MKDLENIRILIDRFYSGDCSSDDLEALEDFMRKNRQLPHDMAVDREIILAMSEASEVKVPERLKRAVENIGRRPRRYSFLYAVSSVAAAVLLAIGTWVAFGSVDKQDATHDAMAERSTALPSEKSNLVVADSSVEDGVESGNITREVPESTSRVGNGRTAAGTRSQNHMSAKKVQHVSERERRAAERSVELLNRALSKMDKAYANVDAAFVEIDKTISNIEQ